MEKPSDHTPEVSSTFASNVTPTSPVAVPVKKKSRHTGLVILLIVLLAIAGGVAGYMVARFAGMTTQPAAPQTVVVEKQKEVEKPKHLALLEDLSKQISAGDIQNTGQAPDVQLDSTNYAVAPIDSAPTLKFTKTASESKTTLASIVSYFKAKNYTEKVVVSAAESPNTISHYTTYDVKCRLASGTVNAADSKSPIEISVTCLDKPSYEKLAATIKPYFDAFASTSDYNKTSTPLFYVKEPVAKASQTSGYQTAGINMTSVGVLAGGYQGLFYQTPDKVWHYLTGSQDILPCTTFSSVDIKKAFLGEKCFDTKSNKSSTVQL